jgi:hypothetical protein
LDVGNEYGEAYGVLLSCLGVRNTLAHSHWVDWPLYDGLFYTDLADAADGHGTVRYKWYHVDEKLLAKWEKYFLYTYRCITFLQEKARYRLENRKAPLPVQWPSRLLAPPPHNPPEEHVPPWWPTKDGNPPAEPPKTRAREQRKKLKAERKTKWKKSGDEA